MIVAPVRALLQRLGPLEGDGADRRPPGTAGRRGGRSCPNWWPRATGASTRWSTAASSPCAAASSTCSPRRPTSRSRIDLWGDEVDRLTAFSVERPAVVARPRRGRALRLPRARLPRRRCAPRPTALVARRPWGASSGSAWPRASSSTAWSRGCPSLDRRRAGAARPAGAGGTGGAGRAAADPRPAVELLDEEAALAETLAATWGAGHGGGGRASRACTCPSTACCARAEAGVAALPPVPEGPAAAALTVRRFDPVAGDPARLAAGVDAPGRQGYSVTLCAATGGGGDAARRRRWRRRVSHAPVPPPRPARPGACVVAAPLTQRVHPPRCQGGGALGDRRHRPARAAPPGPPAGAGRRRLLRRPGAPGASSCTASTAWRASRGSPRGPWAGPPATT